MTPYDEMPLVEMTSVALRALEDRSNFLGLDRVPGHRFRCNLNFCGGPPRWVVGTFGDFMETARWERVVFTDGPAPEHTTEELQNLIRRYEEATAATSSRYRFTTYYARSRVGPEVVDVSEAIHPRRRGKSCGSND